MKNPNANSDAIARRYMDSLVIEERLLGAVTPSAKVTFLGREFETPIMTGALSHLKNGRLCRRSPPGRSRGLHRHGRQ